MLGRKVAERIAGEGPEGLVADEVVEVAGEADLFVLNLECCISERGTPWPDPRKPFFFRAPPAAVEVLRRLGVDCVTLANNHALDFGAEALLDTFEHLSAAGIPWVGAGRDVREARAPAFLRARGSLLAVLGCSDHPEDYGAGEDAVGIAYGLGWVAEEVASLDADIVLVTPHWGPNMAAEPRPYVRDAAASFRAAGATLVAGHSAHVFHGVAPGILYDLGDFLDDYAVDSKLRNDLGLLFLVTFERGEATRIQAVPLKLDFCHTRLAEGDDSEWIRRRFRAACAALGTNVADEKGRLAVSL
jgi:poly-gamma-glutamate capsule biosynthesis protein CapA/YwtB (metallophosphatase superfamily)